MILAPGSKLQAPITNAEKGQLGDISDQFCENIHAMCTVHEFTIGSGRRHKLSLLKRVSETRSRRCHVLIHDCEFTICAKFDKLHRDEFIITNIVNFGGRVWITRRCRVEP